LPKTVKFLGISLRRRWVILFGLVLVALPRLPFRRPWFDIPSGMLFTLTMVAMAVQSIWLATSQWTRTPQHVRLVLSTLLMVVCWLCWATIEAWATFTLNKSGQAPPAFFQLGMTGMACMVVGAALYVRPSAAVPESTRNRLGDNTARNSVEAPTARAESKRPRTD
jgi:hypothetical protein